MSNLYNAFLGLIPSYPTLVGEVTEVDGEAHTVELLGGSAIVCQSSVSYDVGTKVFIKDKKIESESPNNALQEFRV